jgi:hypothetical protein
VEASVGKRKPPRGRLTKRSAEFLLRKNKNFAALLAAIALFTVGAKVPKANTG